MIKLVRQLIKHLSRTWEALALILASLQLILPIGMVPPAAVRLCKMMAQQIKVLAVPVW
jgi:precorrin isomerase